MRRSSSPSTRPTNPVKSIAAAVPTTGPSTGGGPGIWREPIPMKPRRGLFKVLLIVLAVWVGVLVGLYVTMVRPRHQPHRAPAGDSSMALPQAPAGRPVTTQ